MFQRDRFHIPNSYLPALLERHMFVGIFKERWDRAYIIYAERCPKNTAIYPQIGPLFDKRCADIKELYSNLYKKTSKNYTVIYTKCYTSLKII